MLIRVDELIGDFDELLLEFGRNPLSDDIPIKFSNTGFLTATLNLDNETCDAFWSAREAISGITVGIGTDVLGGGLEVADVYP